MIHIRPKMTAVIALLSTAQLPAAALSQTDAPSAEPQFNVSVLENIPSGTYTVPIAINNSGQVLGWAFAPGPCNPLGCGVVWNSLKPTLLGSVKGALFTRPVALNDQGQAVGLIYFNYHTNAANLPAVGIHYPYKAVVWNNYEPTLLGSIPPSWSASATSINNSGQIVGYSFRETAGEDGLIWSGTEPSRLRPCAYSPVNNNNGDIACSASGDDNPLVLLSGGMVTTLPQLGGDESGASAINDSDEIVGYSSTADGVYRGAYWHDGKLTVLQSPGSQNTSAAAINSQGQIVGSATNANGDSYAAYWPTKDSDPINLNTVIGAATHAQFILSYAVGINDNCNILVDGTNRSNGKQQSYVLTLANPAQCH